MGVEGEIWIAHSLYTVSLLMIKNLSWNIVILPVPWTMYSNPSPVVGNVDLYFLVEIRSKYFIKKVSYLFINITKRQE